MLGRTTIVNMDNEVVLKINLEDLSYSRTRDSVVQKTLLPSILLHGQSEDVEARTTAHLVHKTVHEAFTNHIKVLANTIGIVMKEVFFGAPVDQVGLSYFNGYNPSAIGSSVPCPS